MSVRQRDADPARLGESCLKLSNEFAREYLDATNRNEQRCASVVIKRLDSKPHEQFLKHRARRCRHGTREVCAETGTRVVNFWVLDRAERSARPDRRDRVQDGPERVPI